MRRSVGIAHAESARWTWHWRLLKILESRINGIRWLPPAKMWSTKRIYFCRCIRPIAAHFCFSFLQPWSEERPQSFYMLINKRSNVALRLIYERYKYPRVSLIPIIGSSDIENAIVIDYFTSSRWNVRFNWELETNSCSTRRCDLSRCVGSTMMINVTR